MQEEEHGLEADLDESSELLEEGQGIVRHGVNFGSLPIPALAAAGGVTHLSPSPIVGQSLMNVAAGA